MSETTTATMAPAAPASNAKTRLYEGMFLLDAGRASANFEDSLNHVRNLLDRAGATLVVHKRWDDSRKLAYEVEGHKRGAYLLVYFRCDPLKIGGLERDAQLSELVLRCLIVRRDRMTDEQAHSVKTVAEIKEEEARKERERAASEAARARPSEEPGEGFEVPREVSEDFR
jgi:small subunit ribosomal protein S6